jgi:hypothetical protein
MAILTEVANLSRIYRVTTALERFLASEGHSLPNGSGAVFRDNKTPAGTGFHHPASGEVQEADAVSAASQPSFSANHILIND